MQPTHQAGFPNPSLGSRNGVAQGSVGAGGKLGQTHGLQSPVGSETHLSSDELQILSSFASLDADAFADLPKRLEAELKALDDQSEEIAARNYSVFVDSARCFRATQEGVTNMMMTADKVASASQKFTQSAGSLLASIQRVRHAQQQMNVLIRHQSSIERFLSAPEALAHANSIGATAEALEILRYVESVVKAYAEKSPLVQVAYERCLAHKRDLSLQLIARLSSSVDLSESEWDEGNFDRATEGILQAFAQLREVMPALDDLSAMKVLIAARELEMMASLDHILMDFESESSAEKTPSLNPSIGPASTSPSNAVTGRNTGVSTMSSRHDRMLLPPHVLSKSLDVITKGILVVCALVNRLFLADSTAESHKQRLELNPISHPAVPPSGAPATIITGWNSWDSDCETEETMIAARSQASERATKGALFDLFAQWLGGQLDDLESALQAQLKLGLLLSTPLSQLTGLPITSIADKDLWTMARFRSLAVNQLTRLERLLAPYLSSPSCMLSPLHTVSHLRDQVKKIKAQFIASSIKAEVLAGLERTRAAFECALATQPWRVSGESRIAELTIAQKAHDAVQQATESDSQQHAKDDNAAGRVIGDKDAEIMSYPAFAVAYGGILALLNSILSGGVCDFDSLMLYVIPPVSAFLVNIAGIGALSTLEITEGHQQATTDGSTAAVTNLPVQQLAGYQSRSQRLAKLLEDGHAVDEALEALMSRSGESKQSQEAQAQKDNASSEPTSSSELHTRGLSNTGASLAYGYRHVFIPRIVSTFHTLITSVNGLGSTTREVIEQLLVPSLAWKLIRSIEGPGTKNTY